MATILGNVIPFPRAKRDELAAERRQKVAWARLERATRELVAAVRQAAPKKTKPKAAVVKSLRELSRPPDPGDDDARGRGGRRVTQSSGLPGHHSTPRAPRRGRR